MADLTTLTQKNCNSFDFNKGKESLREKITRLMTGALRETGKS